jgi:hypothetical protein
MAFQISRNGRRKAAAAVAAAGVVAGGGLWMAGGATAQSDTMKAGWPHSSGAASTAHARAGTQGADLVVRTVETRSHNVDLGRSGETPGDFFLFEERAYKAGTQNVIGRDAARCELGITTFQCGATLKVFGKGKIVVDGALFGENDNKLVITGGTGRYAGVGGEMRIGDGPGNASTLAFYFTR